MPATGLFFLPIPPTQTSPSSTLISHIARSFPADPLATTFSLDHRLFVDTSSLLPNADVSLRKFTSILTLSQLPTKTFVGTYVPRPKKDKAAGAGDDYATSVVTIPASSVDPFTQLIGTKFQPLWAHRQSLVVEAGTALSLKDGEWAVRVGDLRTPSRSNQSVSSNLRGMLVEISYSAAESSTVEDRTVSSDDQTLIRGMLDALTDGTGVQMENSKALFRRTAQLQQAGRDLDDDGIVDWDLAKLYMDMLRGSRG